MSLLRGSRRPLVVGHRGAAAVAPENTLASLEAAVAAGADLVEFDVGVNLVLAHSRHEIPSQPLSLDEALEFLRAHDVGPHVDLKFAGIEEQVVAALRRHGLAEGAVVSAAWTRSLRTLASIAPEVTRAITYPNDRYGVSAVRWPKTVTAGPAAALGWIMPVRARLLLTAARANALTLHHALVTPQVVQAAHARGAPVLAWTANQPTLVERLVAAGVDAVISDDPGMVVRTLSTLNGP